MKGIVEHVKRRSTMPEIHLASDSRVTTPEPASSTPLLESPIFHKNGKQVKLSATPPSTDIVRPSSSQELRHATPADVDYFVRRHSGSGSQSDIDEGEDKGTGGSGECGNGSVPNYGSTTQAISPR